LGKEAVMAADAVRTGFDVADLEDLAPLSKRLNAATDEPNQVLESIQSRLNALSLGVEAWLDSEESDALAIRVDEENGDGSRTLASVELGYGRYSDGWMLLVREVRYRQSYEPHALMWEYEEGDRPSMVDTKPLLKASRHLRVKAVDRIPKLIDALTVEASNVIAAVEKAKKIAESLK